ncbi:MAG TPA: SIS domain-containing protein, partial [Candidatus Eisenbacteria bacterium]|nr:SIS domain-containing protein [Candidatus Eisenbacteria bacterium]
MTRGSGTSRRARPRGRGSARIKDAFTESVRLLAAVYARDAGAIERMGELVAETASRGGVVFFAGNGGSAAEAQHFATELVCR